MATPKKKAGKKQKAEKAGKPIRATASGSKQRTRPIKRGAIKTKTTTEKTSSAKKRSKKTLKKSTKKTKLNNRGSIQNKASEKSNRSSVDKRAKPAVKKSKAKSQFPNCKSQSSFYITTAIAYPNGLPHIGHAYEAIATDALARFQQLDGKDVFFLTGTDEHGQKMVQTAASENLPTELVAERNAAQFKAMDERLNVKFSRFIRTTEPQHHASSKAIWERMRARGDIYSGKYAGWYSVRDEAYYAESETIVGEDNVRRGPQGTPVDWVEEKSYFFKLSSYQNKLLALYKNQPDFIGPDST